MKLYCIWCRWKPPFLDFVELLAQKKSLVLVDSYCTQHKNFLLRVFHFSRFININQKHGSASLTKKREPGEQSSTGHANVTLQVLAISLRLLRVIVNTLLLNCEDYNCKIRMKGSCHCFDGSNNRTKFSTTHNFLSNTRDHCGRDPQALMNPHECLLKEVAQPSMWAAHHFTHRSFMKPGIFTCTIS